MRSVRGVLACSIALGVGALGIVVVACSGDDTSSGSGEVTLPDRVELEDTFVPGSCAPKCIDESNFQACVDGSAATVPCKLGCNASATRCFVLDPSGVAAPEDLAVAAGALDLSAAGTYVLSTDDGSIKGPAGEVRASGTGVVSGVSFKLADQLDDSRFGQPSPRLGLFSMRALVLGPQSVLRVVGLRAASILVAEDAKIDGTVYAGGDCDAGTPGPGGFTNDQGPRKGAGGAFQSCPLGINGGTTSCGGGGGGGGGGDAGGTGGNVGANIQGGAGGAAYPSLAGGPFALIGGSGGGSSVVGTGLGGAGGGALQIAAGGTLTVNGVVDAAGCGGKLGGGQANAGGGGGAGGMIVLEGGAIVIGGKVVANGGGGASGSGAGNAGAAGAQGTQTTAGGAGGAANACPGGHGGGADAGAANGSGCNAVFSATRTAAGGGGAAGRVVFRGTISGTAQVLSPTPDVGPAAKN